MFKQGRRRIILPLLTIFATLIFCVSLAWAKTTTARGKSSAPTRAASVAPDRYRVDAARSQFTVRAFVGGLLSSFGHNHNIAVRNFTGEARLEDASVQINVRADSLAVVDKVSAKEREEIEKKMRDEVLETSKYPEITFRSTSVQAQETGKGKFNVRIEGELMLHGVRRKEVINAQVSVEGNDVRGRGEFQIRQSDYKIKPPSVGMGTVKVKDALKLSFDIIAHK